MKIKLIQKRSDPVVRHLRQVRDGKNENLVFCEGLKLVEEMISTQIPIEGLYCLKGSEGSLQILLKNHQKENIPLVLLTESVIKFVSDLKSPPGIIAIGERPLEKTENGISDIKKPFVLVLHQIQLPQNVGGLLRTAEASGVTEVWLTNGTASPYGPKALRGSAGSAFRIPIRSKLKLHDALHELGEAGIHVIGAVQDGKTAYSKVKWNQPTALVLGSEGAGFTIEEMKYMKDSVTIPMEGHVESLNVGIAAAICLFEAKRQRHIES